MIKLTKRIELERYVNERGMECLRDADGNDWTYFQAEDVDPEDLRAIRESEIERCARCGKPVMLRGYVELLSNDAPTDGRRLHAIHVKEVTK